MLHRRCPYGRVRHQAPTDVLHHALCHSMDCRRRAGGLLIDWIIVVADQIAGIKTIR